jgi:hypothetical protein
MPPEQGTYEHHLSSNVPYPFGYNPDLPSRAVENMVFSSTLPFLSMFLDQDQMTKPHRKLKKANHGARAANSKARKAKRKKIRT